MTYIKFFKDLTLSSTFSLLAIFFTPKSSTTNDAAADANKPDSDASLFSKYLIANAAANTSQNQSCRLK